MLEASDRGDSPAGRHQGQAQRQHAERVVEVGQGHGRPHHRLSTFEQTRSEL